MNIILSNSMGDDILIIHIVRAGDTLYSIAELYGVSAERLRTDNGLSPTQRLAVGQALVVLIPSIVYTVRQGDTLQSIADFYGITVVEILQNNPSLILDPTLYPESRLAIAFRGGKTGNMNTTGYAYGYIDRDILLRKLPFMSNLAVFSYGFKESGELIPVNDSQLIAYAYEYGAAPVLVFTTIDEQGSFSGDKANALFYDLNYQNLVLENVITAMLNKGYTALDEDFEYIDPDDADAYIAFLENARDKLHANGLLLNVALAPKTSAEQQGLLYEAHDYERIGAIADNVLLMTYEWGYTYGPPLPVAPLNQVRRVIEYGVSAIPIEKIQMGIPNYGYDWTLPYEKGISKAQSLGNQTAVALAAENNAEIMFDETAMSPYFEYASQGREHIVWFEDIRSIKAKFDLADEFGITAVGYWNIMRPFAQNSAYLSYKYNIEKLN